MDETLEYLEKVLSGLRARYIAGEKSIENQLRAVAAKIDQIRLQTDLGKPQTPINILKEVGQQLAKAVRGKRSCCR